MAQNQDKQTLVQSKRCIKCTKMFGNPNFDDMCSVCFKKEKAQQKLEQHLQLEKAIQEQKKQKQEIPIPKNEQKIVGKCATCSRKTKLLGYTCNNCDREFCRMHRLPEEHECTADFISLGKKKIKTQNPNITNKKIEQI